MRIPGGKAVQRLISQAYVELIFPLATHYFTVNPLIKQMDEAGKGYLRKQVRDPTVRDGDVPPRPASTVEVYWRSRRFPLRDYRFTAMSD
jgi:hypothetical protein